VQELLDHLLAGGDVPAGSCSPPRGAGSHEGLRSIALPQFATRTHGRFVGRERELERLSALIGQARFGHRQLVLLEGEPGIGKTRLAAQFAATCRDAGVTVLAGRCDAEAIVPYQPFIQALRPYLSMIPGPELRERLGVQADDLSRMLPELGRGPYTAEYGGAREDRYRLFEAVCALLAEITTAAPVALILDDLHWADKPTLLMLRHLVRVEEDAPLLILGIYRDTERGADLLDTLADLRREHFFETVRLSGLDEQEASELVAALSDRALHTDADRALWRETKGNPFFLEEMVRNMPAGPAEITPIPEGVRTVIRRRLAHHSDDVGRVLAVAAVTGSEFSIELLERVSDLADLTEDLLYDALDEAVAAQLLIEDAERVGRFAFSHSLMRQTLYEDLTLARRGRLHLHVGEALESLAAEEGTFQLGELARHFLAAPPSRASEKAIRYAIEAGHDAMRMLAFEEAERLYQLALVAMERRGGESGARLQLLLTLGDAQVKLGVSESARTTFTHALALASETGDADAFALAVLGLGARGYMAGGDPDDELIALLEEAFEQLPPVDSPLRARRGPTRRRTQFL
jgi:predicted ATPase